MTTETVTTPAPSTVTAPAATPTAPAPSAPPASQGEENKVPGTWDEIFQHPRFKELNQKAKDAQAALDAKATADAAAEQERKIKAGQHEVVIAELQPFKQRATDLEAVITTMVDAEIAAIPKERQSLVPDLSPEKKLAWIIANRAHLMGTKKGDVGHPTNPADGTQPGGDNQTFTTAQIKDVAFYDKNKDAIKAALRDGRIRD